MIEYGNFEYDLHFHHTDTEKEIDKLMTHFSNPALMWKVGWLSLNDLGPARYFLVRIIANGEIKKYMEWLDSWTKQAGIGSHPYDSLKELIAAWENPAR